jgi:NADH:ubiquinone oxidoreductase subunit C
MYKKYIFPINIFIVFEKLNTNIWSSKLLKPNHFFLLIDQNWFYALNLYFKNDLFLNNSTLIDNSAIDTLKFSKINNNLDFFFKKNRIIVYYSYYFYNLKLKLNIILLNNLLKKNKVTSIDKIYKNANWLERETSEMFGVNYYNKKDIRKLLLDYSKIENPLLKDFPVEGFSEAFYDFFEDQVIFLNNDSIEL